MVASRNASRNSADTNAELDGLDRGNQAASGNTYDAGPDGPQAWHGDADAPFVKALPFTEVPVPWFGPEPIIGGAAFEVTDEVDVSDWRLLQVLIEMSWDDAVAATAQLALVAEHLAPSVFAPGTNVWYVTGVVDATVTYVTQLGFGDGFGARVFAPSQLRSQVFTAVGARTVRMCLQFDVTNASKFRLNVGQLIQGQTSLVALAYQRSN
jgi:hypothetical protein